MRSGTRRKNDTGRKVNTDAVLMLVFLVIFAVCFIPFALKKPKTEKPARLTIYEKASG